MKFKIGDKVRVSATIDMGGAIDMDGVVVGVEAFNGYAVKIEGFKGHNCGGFNTSSGLSSLEEDGWWCSDKELTLIEPKDSIVKSVRKDLKDRSNVGIKKYGVTLDRKDLELLDWLRHAYEECLDQALYLKRAIKELETNKK